MLKNSYDVSLDGVPYRLAPLDERYVLAAEPLRPPNAQVLLGQDNQFNLRPELLRWRMTDWSGGEGQFAYDGSIELGNQYWKGRGVDGFSRYGVIRPGYALSVSSVNAGVTRVGRSVYAFPQTASTVQKWNGSEWLSTNDFHGTARRAVVGDQENLYYYAGTGLYRQAPGGAQTLIATGLPGSLDPLTVALVTLRDLLFFVAMGPTPAEQGVWQAQKTATTATPATLIYTLAGYNKADSVGSCVSVGSNRVYVVTAGDDYSSAIVHEVIPDDASATGYGYVRATVPGVYPDASWFHQGYLWVSGPTDIDGYHYTDHSVVDPDGRVLFYLDFGQGTYGTISSVMKDDDPFGPMASGGAAMGSRSHVAHRASNTNGQLNGAHLFQIDQATGGVQMVGETSTTGVVGSNTVSRPLMRSSGIIVYGVGPNTFVWKEHQPATSGHFISSWFDYGLADSKTITNMEITLREAMTSSDWTINVYFQTDQGGEELSDFTLYETIALTPSSGTTIQVDPRAALDPDDLLFSRIRYAFQFVGPSGTPTDHPEITTIEANARAVRSVNSRDLWLLLDDEQSMLGRRGKTQIQNLRDLGSAGVMFELEDGYLDRQPGASETTTVTMDAYRVFLDRPGEGVAWVRLLEVD